MVLKVFILKTSSLAVTFTVTYLSVGENSISCSFYEVVIVTVLSAWKRLICVNVGNFK